MRATSFAAIVATTATLGLPGAPALAQDNEQQLGTVHFPTSCNETAQRRFDRAMRYQHSFWYKASQEIYQDTLKADPASAHLPVVVSTAYHSNKELAEKLGGVWLPKPWSSASLVACLRDSIASHQRRDARINSPALANWPARPCTQAATP